MTDLQVASQKQWTNTNVPTSGGTDTCSGPQPWGTYGSKLEIFFTQTRPLNSHTQAYHHLWSTAQSFYHEKSASGALWVVKWVGTVADGTERVSILTGNSNSVIQPRGSHNVEWHAFARWRCRDNSSTFGRIWCHHIRGYYSAYSPDYTTSHSTRQ